jgi:type IV pilus assembly protein PilA
MGLRYRLTHEKETGFTLMELVMVISIMGILAAIAVPLYVNQKKYVANSSVETLTIAAWGVVGSHYGSYSSAPNNLSEAKVKGLGTTDAPRLALVKGLADDYCVLGYKEGTDYGSPSEAFKVMMGTNGAGYVEGECSIPYTNVVWE